MIKKLYLFRYAPPYQFYCIYARFTLRCDEYAKEYAVEKITNIFNNEKEDYEAPLVPNDVKLVKAYRLDENIDIDFDYRIHDWSKMHSDDICNGCEDNIEMLIDFMMLTVAERDTPLE